MNAYEILGVKPGATAEEIKKAYHRLAHQHHPDKGGSIEKMKEINAAYQEIKDAKGGYSTKQAAEDIFGSWGSQDFRWAWRDMYQEDFTVKIHKLQVDSAIRTLHEMDQKHPEFDIRGILKREFNL